MTVLDDVDQVLEETQSRKQLRVDWDFFVERASDLNLSYDPLLDEYRASFRGQNFRLSKKAIETACRLILASPGYFNQFPDRTEFVRQFETLIDAKAKAFRLFVRAMPLKDGLAEIRGIHSSSFVVLDDFDLLNPAVSFLRKTGHDIAGIHRHESAERVYRVVFADSYQKNDRICPSLYLSNDEDGQCRSWAALGNFRFICSNGMIDASLNAGMTRWNHKRSARSFLRSVGRLVERAGRLEPLISQRLDAAQQTKAPSNPGELVYRWGEDRRLPKEASRAIIEQLRCESVESEMDLINTISWVARSFQGSARRQMESLSHRILIDGVASLNPVLSQSL